MLNKGKLIVLEGNDGSGKQTQSQLLFESFKKEGKNVKLISFPNYDSESSSLVKMYLNGDFGENPADVNVYASSLFYSMDRFASYNTIWKEFYDKGGIVIADRYTTANMIHQGVKFKNINDKINYLDWLCDMEFNLLKLPKPDNIIFLNVTPEASEELRKKRINKITNKEDKDIHEKNIEYMKNCYDNSLFIAERYNWDKIDCCDGSAILPINNIHKKIRTAIITLK